jgi:hypothetical protein
MIFTFRKACFGGKAKGMTIHFVNNWKIKRSRVFSHPKETKGVIHRSPRPTWSIWEIWQYCPGAILAETKGRDGASGNYPRRSHLSNREINPHDVYRRPTSFLKFLYQQKHCQVNPKRIKRAQDERSLPDSPNPTSMKQANKATQLKTCATFHE